MEVFHKQNSSSCDSLAVIDSGASDFIAIECQNQHLCAQYESNMDCVRLKRRRRRRRRHQQHQHQQREQRQSSSDASITSSAIVSLSRTKESQQSIFRRGYVAIRNSFNNRNSRRFRYMNSVSLSMTDTPTVSDRNNNGNDRMMRICHHQPNDGSDDRSTHHQFTYVHSLSSSIECIGANDANADGVAKPIR